MLLVIRLIDSLGGLALKWHCRNFTSFCGFASFCYLWFWAEIYFCVEIFNLFMNQRQFKVGLATSQSSVLTLCRSGLTTLILGFSVFNQVLVCCVSLLFCTFSGCGKNIKYLQNTAVFGCCFVGWNWFFIGCISHIS